jgi:RNA polymerase sigma-70 factor (ECF subfamily)
VEYRETVEDAHWNDQGDQVKNENTRMLRFAIRKLPETERAIITLHLDGYSNPEIAEIMGISPNNATVKLHRIKHQLISQLQPQFS